MDNKLGVYICSGCDIGKCLNMEQLENVAKSEFKPESCRTNEFLCSNEGFNIINEDIKSLGIDKIVIAACSMRSKQHVFNFDQSKIFTERVNLREHVTWVSEPNSNGAQTLAEDYLRMGITRAKKAEITVPLAAELNKTILVVGGGVTGLTAALNSAKAGYNAILIEKKGHLGGFPYLKYKKWETSPPFENNVLIADNLSKLIDNVENSKRIKIYKNSEIEEISGAPGKFEVKIKIKINTHVDINAIHDVNALNDNDLNDKDLNEKDLNEKDLNEKDLNEKDLNEKDLNEKDLNDKNDNNNINYLNDKNQDGKKNEETVIKKAGAIIVATGWKPYDAHNLSYLGYGLTPDILTNVELEELYSELYLKNGREDFVVKRKSDGKDVKSVAFILCAGSRDENYLPYCSAVCCMASLKEANLFRRNNPDAKVYVIYRDIRTPGEYENYYKSMQNDDGIFMVKGLMSDVAINGKDNTIKLKVNDTLFGGSLDLNVDMVVLASGMVPNSGNFTANDEIISASVDSVSTQTGVQCQNQNEAGIQSQSNGTDSETITTATKRSSISINPVTGNNNSSNNINSNVNNGTDSATITTATKRSSISINPVTGNNNSSNNINSNVNNGTDSVTITTATKRSSISINPVTGNNNSSNNINSNVNNGTDSVTITTATKRSSISINPVGKASDNSASASNIGNISNDSVNPDNGVNSGNGVNNSKSSSSNSNPAVIRSSYSININNNKNKAQDGNEDSSNRDNKSKPSNPAVIRSSYSININNNKNKAQDGNEDSSNRDNKSKPSNISDSSGNSKVNANSVSGTAASININAIGVVPKDACGNGLPSASSPVSGAASCCNTTPSGLAPALKNNSKGGLLNLTYRQGKEMPDLIYGFPDSNFICFPYESRRTGIYPAGSVRAPMDTVFSVDDAKGAVLKAIQCIEQTSKGRAVHPRSNDITYPFFDLQRCTQCKRCTEECPFGAIDEDEKGTPKPNPERCRRCGVCMGACPVKIISFKNYSVDIIGSMLKSINVPGEAEKIDDFRILVFACENDAYPALDVAGMNKMQLPSNIRVIPVRCLGSINNVWYADALSRGIDGILLLGCKFGDDYQCHFIKGSELASYRMENLKETLTRLVLESERIKQVQMEFSDYWKLPDILNEFAEKIKSLGPNPYKEF
jgi:heterodisulfide reductase subunit A-like polyferredoxin/coenzyme F420-reducing hydrogenase delta subunit